MVRTQITEAIVQLQSGDRHHGRTALLDIWNGSSGELSQLERCVIAHYLADTEERVEKELAWDLEALKAASDFSGGPDPKTGTADLAQFLPSLHLNAGDAYRRIGDLENARIHVATAILCSAALPDDGYGATIRNALKRLELRCLAAG